MLTELRNRMTPLDTLDETVSKAADFFADIDDDFFDGYETAREVLSQLVFWHREYVRIVTALVNGREPKLRRGTYAQLGAQATREFTEVPLRTLSLRLLRLQAELTAQLRRLPNWEVVFPVKWGSRHITVTQRLATIEARISQHLRRMERAQRHGKDWIEAYFLETA